MRATCHCGAVAIEVDAAPESVTECNCSICRRLGVLWAYYRSAEVRVVKGEGTTGTYIWGDRYIEFHHCPTYGCTTHNVGIRDDAMDRVAVNARLLPLDAAAPVPVRRFDGADSWEAADDGDPWPWPVRR